VLKGDVVPVYRERKIKQEPLLAVNTPVRIKLTEQKGVMRNRATDREYWSKESYIIDSAKYSDDNVRYYTVKKNSRSEPLRHVWYHEELLKI
jgi:hypothetical protein